MQGAKDLTQALYDAAVALGRTRDAEEVVRVAVAETQRATGIEAVALHLLDAERGLLILREYAGTTPAFRERMAALPLAEAQLAATAIRERRAVTWAVPSHPSPTIRALYAEQGFRQVTAVPVLGREQVLAVLHLASRQETVLSPHEMGLVEALGGLVGVALESAALQELMTAQQDRLRALAGGALRAREEEARRIAHALHDEAGQLLASVHIALDELIQRMPEGGSRIRKLHELLDQVETQLRHLSRELRPTILDDLGLGPAVEWLAQRVAERSGLSISVSASVDRLPSAVETALYRIIQEALTNAARHAQASGVRIQVWRGGDTVRAVIRDDGCGFDVSAALARRGDRGLGLIGMRERVETLGGRLGITSKPGQGTELSITLPVTSAPPSTAA